MSEGIGTGCTLAFAGTAGFDGEVESFNLDGEEIAVIDFSHLGSTGYRKKKFGSLIEPPQATINVNFDPAAPPPMGSVGDITITFPDTSTLSGSGAVISRGAEVPLEDKMMGNFVFQFDGETGPTYA